MQVDRSAAFHGTVLAAVPVLSMVVTLGLLAVDVVLPLLLLANVLLVFGLPLLAAPAAFYRTFPEDVAAGSVVAGFAAGAVLYGVGVSAVAWAAGMGTPFPGGHLRFAVWLALLFAAVAALGAVGGDTVGPLFRPPEGEDVEGSEQWGW